MNGTFTPTLLHSGRGSGVIPMPSSVPILLGSAAGNPAAAHFEYTFGMFGLRAHRSARPSTVKGSVAFSHVALHLPD